MARTQLVVGRLDNVVGAEAEGTQTLPLCKRYEDLLGRVLELGRTTELLTTKVQELSGELSHLKETGRSQPSTQEEGPRVKVPESAPFNGVRSAGTLENFLWDVDQYFKASKVPEVEQVPLVRMYLTGDAKLWWRTRQVDDTRAGRTTTGS